MIMMGKVVISLVWAFWMMAMSTVEGQDNKSMSMMDHSKMTLTEIEEVKQMVMEKENAPKAEYNPTYGSTYQRVKER